MDYLLLIFASALFGGMFIFQQMYTRSEGSLLRSALLFSFLSTFMRVPISFILYGFDYSFQPVGLLYALGYAAVGLGTVYFSAKAFAVTNMALYSVFMMLGGMMLPFVTGIAFYAEPFTLGKALCCILVLAAMLAGMTPGGKKSSAKGLLYCLGVFVMNGFSGVFAKINEASEYGLDNGSLFLGSALITLFISGISVLLLQKREGGKLLQKPGKALAASVGYGIGSGAGNLLLLIALGHGLPASVQYPLTTGCTMVFSALFGLCMGEKLNRRTVLSVLLAVAASVVVTF